MRKRIQPVWVVHAAPLSSNSAVRTARVWGSCNVLTVPQNPLVIGVFMIARRLRSTRGKPSQGGLPGRCPARTGAEYALRRPGGDAARVPVRWTRKATPLKHGCPPYGKGSPPAPGRGGRQAARPVKLRRGRAFRTCAKRPGRGIKFCVASLAGLRRVFRGGCPTVCHCGSPTSKIVVTASNYSRRGVHSQGFFDGIFYKFAISKRESIRLLRRAGNFF